MDVMGMRRNLLMQESGVLDTSPKIAQYGVKNPAGNPASKPYIEDANYCVTKLYSYTPMQTKQTLVLYGGNGYVLLYTNDTFTDFWSFEGEASPKRWRIINEGTNKISCTLRISMLDDCYGYMEETGEILFAGKNSVYYGHKNINELS